MKQAFSILFKFLSFGIPTLIRWLVKRRILKSRYHVDLDGDGDIDFEFRILSQKGETNNEKETNED